jgi:hypothetical protein
MPIAAAVAVAKAPKWRVYPESSAIHDPIGSPDRDVLQ